MLNRRLRRSKSLLKSKLTTVALRPLRKSVSSGNYTPTRRPERTSNSWRRREDRKLWPKSSAVRTTTILKSRERKLCANTEKQLDCRKKLWLLNRKRNAERGKS